MFHAIDETLISICEQSVTWIEEWTGLSQRWIERLLIGSFAISFLSHCIFERIIGYGYGSIWILFVCGLIVLASMIIEGQYPSTQRKTLRFTGTFYRLSWVALLILPSISILLSAIEHTTLAMVVAICSFCCVSTRVAMAYVIISSIDGERGRAAKLVWSKIKELFGTSWIPQPIRVEG